MSKFGFNCWGDYVKLMLFKHQFDRGKVFAKLFSKSLPLEPTKISARLLKENRNFH